MRRNKAEPLDFSDDEGWAGGGSARLVTVPERWLARRLVAAVGNPPIAVHLWDGEPLQPVPERPAVRVYIRDRGAFYRLLSHPDLHFGDDYASGRIEVEGDLVQFLLTLERARSADGSSQRSGLLGWIYRPRRNTLAGSQENIHHHYDLGNDFYRLWLDEDMVYTCAYFPDPDADLETAQQAKMEHVCRKLALQPGQRVVEAGCGWGSLARYMAREYGARVRAFNISQEQVAYARERARAEGLADRVEYIQDDYRNVAGEYDAFVSVGMLEHVGTDHYRDLGRAIDRTLAPHGRGLIHSIGRNRPSGPMNPWIERRIFPGAYPPSLGEMMALFEPWAFSVLDVENLRLHYARTLEHWRERYDAHEPEVRSRFGERFLRAWRLYLSGSIAAFLGGNLQLFQVVFARPTNNDLPWTRGHIYREPEPGA